MPGTITSEVEVTHISANGVWLLVRDKEYFLSYEEYPWFKNARVDEILSVELLHDEHIHWRDLDVDLTLKQIERPEDYPLVSNQKHIS